MLYNPRKKIFGSNLSRGVDPWGVGEGPIPSGPSQQAPLYVPGPGRENVDISGIVGGRTAGQGGYNYEWAQPYQAAEPARQRRSSYRAPFQPTTYTTGITTTTGTTTPIAPGIPRPTFTLPERDVGRIKELRRAYMAPVRQVRQGLRRTLASLPSVSNIAVAREMGRGAVEGLGSGISQISEAAGRGARAEYGQERAEEISALNMNFQAAMQDYMARWGKRTTTTTKAEQRRGPQYMPASEFGQTQQLYRTDPTGLLLRPWY